MDIVTSKNNVPIRLTEERWFHIIEEHSEMAGYYYDVLETISNPNAIYEGKYDALIAVKNMEKDKLIVVIYKEINNEDGFIITAFMTKKIKQFERRRKIWQQ